MISPAKRGILVTLLGLAIISLGQNILSWSPEDDVPYTETQAAQNVRVETVHLFHPDGRVLPAFLSQGTNKGCAHLEGCPMRPDPSVNPLAEVDRLHSEVSGLDRFGCDPEPSGARDPAHALASVERLQGEFAQVRESITASSAPFSISERAAVAHHFQVIAASLGCLHQAFCKITEEQPASGAPMSELEQPPRHTVECECDHCRKFGLGIWAQFDALTGDQSAAERLSSPVFEFLTSQAVRPRGKALQESPQRRSRNG